MTGITRRIEKETEELERLDKSIVGFTAIPDKDNRRHFRVVLEGPKDSPYEGGFFKLELFLGREYPMVPPMVRFMTRVYHPNVDKLGRICLDILKDKWSPALQIRTVLLSILALLCKPEPTDGLDPQIAEVFKTDIDLALKTAREWTRMYAMQTPAPGVPMENRGEILNAVKFQTMSS